MIKSLRARLLLMLLGILSVAWLVTLTASYYRTRQLIESELDSELMRIAQKLSVQPRILHRHTWIKGRSGDIEFQIFEDDQLIANSENAPKQSLFKEGGFSSGEADHKNWRVFSTRADKSKIAVGQDLLIRDRLIHEMLVSSLWPMAIALPILAILLWLSVNFAFRPLKMLTGEIQSRSPATLSAIRLSDVPSEIGPVIAALNGLLNSLNLALEREKHFTDDAAHELRTPLAGIKAQAEALLTARNDEARDQGLRAIKLGVDRASRTVQQLLNLARFESSNTNIEFTPIDLSAVAEQALADFAPRALYKNVEVSLSASGRITIRGNAAALELMLTNVLENALKVAPAGSRIDVIVQSSTESEDKQTHLIVEDFGPGIPVADRSKVFNRFVRIDPSRSREGVGIGLAIVKRIADLHGGQIVLSDPAGHVGLRVDFIFPPVAEGTLRLS